MQILIDTSTGKVDMTGVEGSAQGTANEVALAIQGLTQIHDQIAGIAQPDEDAGYVVEDIDTDMEVARINLQTWYDEMTKADDWHVYMHYFAQYELWAEWLNTTEEGMGLPPTYVPDEPPWRTGTGL